MSVILVILVNSRVYANDADWNSFMRYNKARMQLTDYRYDILYYPHNGDKLTEMGITENDALSIVKKILSKKEKTLAKLKERIEKDKKKIHCIFVVH